MAVFGVELWIVTDVLTEIGQDKKKIKKNADEILKEKRTKTV